MNLAVGFMESQYRFDVTLTRRWDFVVVGQPVPWSAPLIGRRGGRRKDPRLIEWQAQVQQEAIAAYGHREPHIGPIFLGLEFRLARPSKSPDAMGLAYAEIEWDENQSRFVKRGGLPDRTNLVKGVEDALEGVFFANDGQVPLDVARCAWGDEPGVLITVGFIAG